MVPGSVSSVPASRSAAPGWLPAVRSAAVRLAGSPVTVVAAIVLGGFGFTAWYAVQVDEWIVMTDELLYTRLSISLWSDLALVPHVHGEYVSVFSQLWPLLQAPVFGLLPMPVAFEAAHALNALLMASAAIPAYLLVRGLRLPRLAGYLVAALTVVTPWMGMSMVLWTESAAYPAFMWAILGIHRAVAAPSRRGDLLALGGIALAFSARTQFAFLAAVLPVAIVLHEAGLAGRRPREIARALRRSASGHRVLLVAYGLLALAALLLAARSSIGSALGAYETTSQGEWLPEGSFNQAGRYLASMTVAIGVVPLVLAGGWALSSLFKPTRRELHAFAVVALLVVPALMLIAGSFSLRFAGGALEDRYVFYAAPLLFAGTAACLLDQRRRWIGVALAGIAFFAIADYASYEESARTPFFWSPSTSFWPVLDGRAYELGQKLGLADLTPVGAIEVGTLLLTAALAALLWWRGPSRGFLLAVCLPLLVFLVAETRYVMPVGVTQNGGGGAYTGNPPLGERDWVDDALPGDGDVALLPVWVAGSQLEAERIWWQAEFWNKRVNRVFSSNGSTTFTLFPLKTLSVDFATGRVEAEEQIPYLVTSAGDVRFGLDGDRLASGFRFLELLRPELPYRASWTSQNIFDEGWTNEEERVRVRLHSLPGEGPARRVRLRLAAPPDVLSRRPVVLTGGERRVSDVVPLGGESELSVLACVPPGGSRDLTLDVGDHNELPDGRVIGVRVMDIDVQQAPAAACP